MRLRVVSVGRDRSGLFQPAVDTYAGRLRRYLPFELVELPAARAREAARARDEEASRILGAVGPDRLLVALDVGGKRLSSEALAERVNRWMVAGQDVDLVVGGDEGLGDAVRARAALTLSLGPMTLPHRLARVVLVEQLYRALTIVRGEPYHK